MKEEKFLDIPKMPEPFVDWIISKKLVLFVGAGISKLCGYPLWNDLADKLIDYFRDKKCYDYQYVDAIKNGNYSPIQKITIIAEQAGTDLVVDKICEYLEYNKRNCNMKKAATIANLLFAFNSSIITTNADLVLDKNDSHDSFKKYSSTEDVPLKGIGRKTILHLHGCITDKRNLIFTEKQYAKNYLQAAKLGKTLTQIIKSDNTVLFIGYSLSEFELLKYFIDPKDVGEKTRLYKLDGYYRSQEQTKLVLDKAYYKALGIELLPYFMDKKGYDALLDVLNSWISQIESQTSPSGILYLDIAKAISKKPTKTNKELVIKHLNGKEIDPAFIRDKLIESKYCCDWIKALWKDTLLFNPTPYFTQKESDEYLTRSFWGGLLILRDYVEKKLEDPLIELKMMKLIKKSSLLLKTTKLTEAHNNRGAISILLSEIAMKRAKIIEDISIFEPIAKFYISENQYGAYMLAESLIDNQDTFIGKTPSKTLFSIIQLIVKSEKKDKEHLEIFKSSKMLAFILTNPQLYYEESLKQLKKTEWGFITMGSFSNFPAEKNTFYYKEQMYGAWLLMSINYMPNNPIKDDIASLLKSKKDKLNKIGLCLLGERLSENVDIFVHNISKFFNQYQYVADLIQLLKKNMDYIRNEDDKIIVNAIKKAYNTATFGCKDGDYKKAIQKAVSNILSEIDHDFEKTALTDIEIEMINNLDSSASFYSVDTKKEVNSVFDKIKDLKIDEMISYVNGLTKGRSFYFDNSIRKAVDNYFDSKDYSDYKDKIRNIGFNYLLGYVCDRHFVPATNEGANKFLYLYKQFTEEEKKESMSSILFACTKIVESEDVDISNKESLIKEIDYTLIGLEQSEEKELKIGTIINTKLHLYWSILYEMHKQSETFVSNLLLESVHYFYDNYKDSQLLRGIMASWSSFIYYYETSDKKEEMFEYIFNQDNSIACYKAFAYINGNNQFYLNKLCKLERFNDFILNIKDDSQERIALVSRIVLSYIFEGLFEDTYKKVIYSADIEMIEHVFIVANKNPKELIKGKYKDNFNNFLEGCIYSLKKQEKRKFSINQILRFLVDMMIREKDGNLKNMWKLIILTPKCLTYYHDSSIGELLTTFGDTNVKNCKAFLNAFFESYDPIYIIDTYIIELFELLKSNSNYTSEIDHWHSMIGKKNPALYAKLLAKK